jgi:hypothetical protein
LAAKGHEYSQRKVPLPPSLALLLAKALQYLEVKPDPLSPPVLGVAQPSPRFLADPSFHPENHDLMQPLASGVEPGLLRVVSLMRECVSIVPTSDMGLLLDSVSS